MRRAAEVIVDGGVAALGDPRRGDEFDLVLEGGSVVVGEAVPGCVL
jgi:hypothetical protein